MRTDHFWNSKGLAQQNAQYLSELDEMWNELLDF